MSLIGLVNLTERLLNQPQDNGNDGGDSEKSAKQVTPQPVNNAGADEFRPSSANAENEAGLFQVRQQSVFTAAATVLLIENGPTQQATGASTANTNALAATNIVPQAAPQTANNVTATTNTDALAQLQGLNSALAALGLDQAEIDVIDRIAQLIKDFNPAAFTSLVNQLQLLQQDTAQSAAQNTTSANATNTANAASASGFKLEAFTIKFAGVNETLQQGGNGSNANGGTIQVSAFQFQISEVQLFLGNKTTGQTAAIQSPQVTTTATKAATA